MAEQISSSTIHPQFITVGSIDPEEWEKAFFLASVLAIAADTNLHSFVSNQEGKDSAGPITVVLKNVEKGRVGR